MMVFVVQRVYDTDWHHVAITVPENPVFGLNKLYLYLDGIKVYEGDNDYNYHHLISL